MRRRLRASLDVDAHTLADDEPLVLGGLEHFGVKQGVLDGLLAGHSLDAITARLRAGGALPAGEPGAVGLRRAVDETAPLAEAALAFGPGAPHALSVTLGDRTVVGTADRLTPAAAVRVRPSQLKTRDLVRAWTEHLARAAAGDARPTVALGTDGARTFAALDAETATALLDALVRGLDKIRERPPPLFERASRAYAEALSDPDRAAVVDDTLRRHRARLDGVDLPPVEPGRSASGLAKAQKAFRPRTYDNNPPGDLDDPYVDLATRGDDPFENPWCFVVWAETLWAPLLHHSAEGLPT